MAKKVEELSISSDDTFTPILKLRGDFSLSISGALWAGTVTLQRTFDGGVSFVDIEAFTANTEKNGNEPGSGVYYRVGIKATEYTSGTVKVRLSW